MVDGGEEELMDVAREETEAFVCGVCGGTFPVEQVYDDAGSIVCVSCYQQRAAAKTPASSSAPAIAAPKPLSKPAKLLARVTCPHCWFQFPPQDVVWVSEHSDLRGDVILGPDAQSRFLPSRFTPAGQAIDARGMVCHELACPKCHLPIPRVLLDHHPLFISIIGVQASGKSYLLTSMAWELRRTLGKEFGIGFADADPVANRFLNEYEQMLFLAADPDRPVVLEPTQREGHLYDQIRLGRQIVNLPRPVLFSLRKGAGREKELRVLCLYDNAGEHFRPGEDRPGSPVTRHLAMAGVLMFLFDPTQDPRFRERCRGICEHPQMAASIKTERQDVVLAEAAARVRRYAGLAENAMHERPMIVLVGKSDVWRSLIDADIETEPVIHDQGKPALLDFTRVEDVSARLRKLLIEVAPEFVAVAEGFCRHVIYIPVSAIGRAPEAGGFVRPRDIRPTWVTVPVLYMLGAWARGWVEGRG